MSPLPYESMLVLLAAMGLFLPLLKKGDRAWLLSVLALAASLALSVATLYLSMGSEPCYLFSKILRLDPYGSLFSTLALLGALLAVLASKPASKWTTSTSFYSLTLISMVGVCVIAFANDITVALAAWLLSSVASYAIVSLAKDEASAEGGVKYAIMGSASTVFLFMGTFILFLSAGTTLLSSTLRPIPLNPVFGGHTVLVLSILLVAAIGFKMGIFPFQAWLPDTYGGVHPSLIAFVIPMAKALALLALYRLIYPVAVQYPETWFVVASVFSVLTMFFGNLAALLQDDAQRMMAYSSIAHAGYFFVGFAGISALAGLDPKWAMMGLLIHYAAYSLAKVGIFAGLEEVKEKVGGVMLSDLSGLGKAHAHNLFHVADPPAEPHGCPTAPGVLGQAVPIRIRRRVIAPPRPSCHTQLGDIRRLLRQGHKGHVLLPGGLREDPGEGLATLLHNRLGDPDRAPGVGGVAFGRDGSSLTKFELPAPFG